MAGFSDRERGLPAELYRLLDPLASVDLPPAHKVPVGTLDNRELDKLVAALGRSKATWRRALVLHEWLLGLGHAPDDRLCTTLIRVCSQHGQVIPVHWTPVTYQNSTKSKMMPPFRLCPHLACTTG